MDTEIMEYKIRPGVIWIYRFMLQKGESISILKSLDKRKVF